MDFLVGPHVKKFTGMLEEIQDSLYALRDQLDTMPERTTLGGLLTEMEQLKEAVQTIKRNNAQHKLALLELLEKLRAATPPPLPPSRSRQ